MIHFHSSDERFCNSKRKARQFSFDPNEVTCARCKERDSFVLSEEARAYLQGVPTKDQQL